MTQTNRQHSAWRPPSYAADGAARRGRFIEISSPADFERYFVELGELVRASGGRPEFAQLKQLGTRHDTDFQLDWVPELAATYNLRLMTR